MNLAVLLLLAIGAALPLTAVSAQRGQPEPVPAPDPFPPVGGGDHATKDVTSAGERSLYDMASCMAKRHPANVAALLSSDPASVDSERQIVRLFYHYSQCGNRTFVRFSVKRDVMRGILAEQLYLRAYPAPPAQLGTTNAPLAPSSGDPITVRYAVGACAAARDPGDADAVVRAARRSPEESDASRRLAATLNACASGHVDFSGAQLHGVLAEALFKMHRAAAQESSHHA